MIVANVRPRPSVARMMVAAALMSGRSCPPSLRFYELCQLALKRYIVSHIKLFDSCARKTSQDSDQIQFALGFVSRNLLRRQHIGDDRSTDLERRDFLTIVLDRLSQLQIIHSVSHYSCESPTLARQAVKGQRRTPNKRQFELGPHRVAVGRMASRVLSVLFCSKCSEHLVPRMGEVFD